MVSKKLELKKETIKKYRYARCRKEITAPIDMVYEKVYCSVNCLVEEFPPNSLT
jgi:hypothetical protein